MSNFWEQLFYRTPLNGCFCKTSYIAQTNHISDSHFENVRDLTLKTKLKHHNHSSILAIKEKTRSGCFYCQPYKGGCHEGDKRLRYL